jgi:glycosyltransferase involved in cell wall biosynthesis
MARYGAIAKNAKDFQDTSHSRSDVVAWERVTPRLSTLGSRPLRFVYCGRLEPRKGPMQGADLVRRARDLGQRIEFDIIGDGSQREAIETSCREWGITDRVRFLGRMNYGPELIAKLAEYDGLLFTPAAEDTPRMIFDGYAASLPLVGFDIDYVKQCSATDRATFLLPRDDMDQAARRLSELAKDPSPLRSLAECAHAAAFNHSVENWYGRRAAFTIEAFERRSGTGSAVGTRISADAALAGGTSVA